MPRWRLFWGANATVIDKSCHAGECKQEQQTGIAKQQKVAQRHRVGFQKWRPHATPVPNLRRYTRRRREEQGASGLATKIIGTTIKANYRAKSENTDVGLAKFGESGADRRGQLGSDWRLDEEERELHRYAEQIKEKAHEEQSENVWVIWKDTVGHTECAEPTGFVPGDGGAKAPDAEIGREEIIVTQLEPKSEELEQTKERESQSQTIDPKDTSRKHVKPQGPLEHAQLWPQLLSEKANSQTRNAEEGQAQRGKQYDRELGIRDVA